MRHSTVALSFMILMSIGCGSGPERPTAVASSNHLRSSCSGIVRVAYLQDKSASTQAAGVYQLRLEELRSLADLIIRCGGELGIGLVGDKSGFPLERWFVQRPKAPPEPPSNDETPINAAITQSEYEVRRAAYDQEERSRIEKAEADFAAFSDRVRALLGREPNETRTPLWQALARADAFLGEPDTTSAGRSSRYVVLSSDGANNVGSPIPLTSGAALYICNGPKAVGSLVGLAMTLVESPIGAFRTIIDLENAHADN